MEELRSVRTKLRSRATKLCNDLKAYRQGDPKSLDQDPLALKAHNVEELLHEYLAVQVQLDKGGHTDDSSHVQTMKDEVFLSSRVLARLEKAKEAEGMTEAKSSIANSEFKSSLAVKIPVFQGDAMKWSEFWELFLISVHQNSGFEDVQKFVILKSHLAGLALRVIQGIPVSSSGYTEAVEALKERFDRDCRETLMRELLNMPSVRSNDLKALRSLSDHITAHTRALNSLGVTSESFSTLLLPIVKEKLPESWRIEWARQDKSEFSDFLKFLQQELRVQESARGAIVTDVPSKVPSPSAAVVASLNAQRRPRSSVGPASTHNLCPACNRETHLLSQCESFMKMEHEARWAAVVEVMACFRCLMVGHRARNCLGWALQGVWPKPPCAPAPSVQPWSPATVLCCWHHSCDGCLWTRPGSSPFERRQSWATGRPPRSGAPLSHFRPFAARCCCTGATGRSVQARNGSCRLG